MYKYYLYICTYICIMGYYSAIKKEITAFVATCMDLKIVLLSEISQIEKEKYHITSHK